VLKQLLLRGNGIDHDSKHRLRLAIKGLIV